MYVFFFEIRFYREKYALRQKKAARLNRFFLYNIITRISLHSLKPRLHGGEFTRCY